MVINMFKEFKIPRIGTIGIIYIVLISILAHRLFTIQILNGEEYFLNIDLSYKKTKSIKNTRGNIYDRNGKLLATSRLAYSITIEDSEIYATSREKNLALNSAIYHMLQILNKNKEMINNDLKIKVDSYDNFAFTVEGTSLDRFKADIYGRARIDELTEDEKNASAEQIVKYLASEQRFSLFGTADKPITTEEIEKYGLENSYSKTDMLNILGIRYMLSMNSYQRYLPVVVATDVSDETVAYIRESNNELPGVDVLAESVREYYGGEAFAHILGYTGNISAEELSNMPEDTEYTISSIIGKSGIEQEMEEVLQGKDGYEEFNVDNVGRIIGEPIKRVEPVAGNDVYLSIDKDLQIETYNILERQIADILLANIINAKEFDRNNVKDAADIRIPIYDVYFALINNNIIDIDHFRESDATKLEVEVYKIFENKKERVINQLYDELTKVGTSYNKLSKEYQVYESYIVNELIMKKLAIIDQNELDKSDPMYLAWTKEERISLREYLMYAIKEKWVDINKIPSEQTFMGVEEAYDALVKKIINQLEQDAEFDKKIYKYMLLNDELSGTTICKLLYEQKILSKKKDEDYSLLISNSISAYEFMKRKIQKLEITPAQLALDPCSGSAVVVDPDSGKVLACVSYPGYDNNRLANKMDSEYYNQLYNDLSLPLYNRATQQLTAPGSTFKPITVIAGYKEGVINYNTSIYCDGVFDKIEPPLRCWKRSGHGHINTIAEALANSCNDYLSEISYRLGMENRLKYSEDQALGKLQDYAKLFNLDKKSGIEIVESAPQISDRYAIPSAIGQGTHNFSTVQLARYVNTLANRGTSYQLSLVDKVLTPDETRENKHVVESTIELPENIWDGISVGMKQFAETNELLKNMDITVAGKTGTAQEAKNRPDHALFVGYAPMKNPEISIAVRIAHGYKSANAVEVTKNVIEYYFNK